MKATISPLRATSLTVRATKCETKATISLYIELTLCEKMQKDLATMLALGYPIINFQLF